MTPDLFKRKHAFRRLKSLGFKHIEELREFSQALNTVMEEKDYNISEVVEAIRLCVEGQDDVCEMPKIKGLRRPGMLRFLSKMDLDRLKQFARWFMEDCYEVCNVSHYPRMVNAEQTSHNLSLRQFRHRYPWLRHNLSGTDRFNKMSGKKTTVFYGVRSNPERPEEQIAMVAHMGGSPTQIKLGDLLQLEGKDWEIAIASPGLEIKNIDAFELQDTQGVLLTQKEIT